MIGLLQRVSHAGVEVAGEQVAAIGRGLLVLLAIQPADTEIAAERLIERLLAYRVFPDDAGRMNLSLKDIGGGLLLVPQFTLAADTGRGNRPSFTSAAPPAIGQRLFACAVALARARHSPTCAGIFGADMQVSSVNDGPVTFWLETPSPANQN